MASPLPGAMPLATVDAVDEDDSKAASSAVGRGNGWKEDGASDQAMQGMTREDSNSAFNLPSWLTATSSADPPPSMLSEDALEHEQKQHPQPQGGMRADVPLASAGVVIGESFWTAPVAMGSDLLDPVPRAYTPSYQSAYSSDAWDRSSSISGLGELAIDDFDSQMDAAEDVYLNEYGGAGARNASANSGILAYDPSQQDTYDNLMQNQALLSSDVFGGNFTLAQTFLPPDEHASTEKQSGAPLGKDGEPATASHPSQWQGGQGLDGNMVADMILKARVPASAGARPSNPAANPVEGSQWSTFAPDLQGSSKSSANMQAVAATNGAGSYALLVSIPAGDSQPQERAPLLTAPTPLQPLGSAKFNSLSQPSSEFTYSESVPLANLQLGTGEQQQQQEQQQQGREQHQHQEQGPQPQPPDHSQMDLVTPRQVPSDTESQRLLFAAALQQARLVQEPHRLDAHLLESRCRSVSGGDTNYILTDLGRQRPSADASAQDFVPQMMANLAQSLQKELGTGGSGSGLGGPGSGDTYASPAHEKPQREDSYDKLKAFLSFDKDQPSNWTPGWAKANSQREDSYDKLKAFLGLDKDEGHETSGKCGLDVSGGLRKRSISDIGPRSPSGATAMSFSGGPGSKTGLTAPAGIFMGSTWQGVGQDWTQEQSVAGAALAMWPSGAQNKAGVPVQSGTAYACGQSQQLPPQIGKQSNAQQELLVMDLEQDSGTRSTMDRSRLRHELSASEGPHGWTRSQGAPSRTEFSSPAPGDPGLMRPRSAGRSSIPSSAPYSHDRVYSSGSIGPVTGGLSMPSQGTSPPTAWRFPNLPSGSDAYPSQVLDNLMDRPDRSAWQIHSKGVRSEDLSATRSGDLISHLTSPDGHLVPPNSAGSASLHRNHPYKGGHRRRTSNASSRSASSTGSSPRHVAYVWTASPKYGSLEAHEGEASTSDIKLNSPVNATVTTAKTQAASVSRRKADAHFQCPFPGCHSTFTRALNLNGHIRSHNDEKPFKCGYSGCLRAFARAHDQKRHQKLHLNIRPHLCEYCGKTFARLDALNRHHKHESTSCGAKAAAANESGDVAAVVGSGGGGDVANHAADPYMDAGQQGDSHTPPISPKDSLRSSSSSKFRGMVL